jgi:hypothetical protein
LKQIADQAKSTVGSGQQQNAAIRTEAPTVERGGDFLLADTLGRENGRRVLPSLAGMARRPS